MEPLQDSQESLSPLQRLAIGAGVLIVVILTVIAAIFLAMQDLPPEEPSPVVQISPTTPAISVTNTPVAALATATPTAPPPTATPTFTPSPSATATPPPADETAPPPTPTDTTQPPTATFTPLPPPPTDTPVPVATTNCGTPPPQGWIAYQVQTGDTFNSLATRTGTSVFDLQEANCLRTIQTGDTLYLPGVPATITPTKTATAIAPRPATPTRTATPIAPRIFTVIANRTDTDIVVVVEGENFRSREQGFRAELIGPTTIPLILGDARTNTSFEASAPIPPDLPADLPQGAYDLVVINPNGRLDTKEDVFPPTNATPTAPPRITQVSPDSGKISEDIRVTIQGQNFDPLGSGFMVEIRGDVVEKLAVDQTERPATSTSFDVNIPAGLLTPGEYDLLVTNPDGQTDIERDAYDAIDD